MNDFISVLEFLQIVTQGSMQALAAFFVARVVYKMRKGWIVELTWETLTYLGIAFFFMALRRTTAFLLSNFFGENALLLWLDRANLPFIITIFVLIFAWRLLFNETKKHAN